MDREGNVGVLSGGVAIATAGMSDKPGLGSVCGRKDGVDSG